MEFNPKDLVIVNRGLSSEEPAIVYMTGPTICAVASLDDGDNRYRVAKSRLTKCDAQGNPLI